MSTQPKAPKAYPPIVELVLQATVWMPVALLLSVSWLVACGAVPVAAIMVAVYLYVGDWWAAGFWTLAMAPLFLLARFLTRRLCE